MTASLRAVAAATGWAEAVREAEQDWGRTAGRCGRVRRGGAAGKGKVGMDDPSNTLLHDDSLNALTKQLAVALVDLIIYLICFL